MGDGGGQQLGCVAAAEDLEDRRWIGTGWNHGGKRHGETFKVRRLLPVDCGTDLRSVLGPCGHRVRDGSEIRPTGQWLVECQLCSRAKPSAAKNPNRRT